jgi:hypothetical protein
MPPVLSGCVALVGLATFGLAVLAVLPTNDGTLVLGAVTADDPAAELLVKEGARGGE